MVPRTDLGELAAQLFEISAQRDHQSLPKSEAQRNALDRSGECQGNGRAIRKSGAGSSLLKRACRAESPLKPRCREEEFLRFAEEELSAIDPKEGRMSSLRGDSSALSLNRSMNH